MDWKKSSLSYEFPVETRGKNIFVIPGSDPESVELMSQAVFYYCKKSLAPIGVVAKQDREAGRSVSVATESG